MYSHVIVGVDGRPGGKDAAALAGTLAEPEAARAIVYVSQFRPPADQPTHPALELADAASLGGLLEEELALSGGHAQMMRVSAPTVGAGLEGTAERHGAELIVVGASRRHGLKRLGGRDDVHSVLEHTPIAVAVAPEGYRRRRRTLSLIGIAFDGSQQSIVALAHGALLAEEHGCEMTIRRVVDPTGDRCAQLVVDGLDVEVVVGDVAGQLADLSRRVDLLVCGSRRPGTLRRLALGSTGEYLARHAQSPLLIAPVSDDASVQRWRALAKVTG